MLSQRDELHDVRESIDLVESISTKIRGILNETHIYRIVKEESRKSNYRLGILQVIDETKVGIAEAVCPQELDAVKKATGMHLSQGFIDIDNSPVCRQVVKEGRTVQVYTQDFITEIFPQPAASVLSEILDAKEKSVLTPLEQNGKITGALVMSSTELTEYSVLLAKVLAQHISTALELSSKDFECKRMEEKQRAFNELVERSKELSCLYEIDEILRRENSTVEDILRDTVEVISPAWQYPEVMGCCVTHDGAEYKTENFKRTESMLKADIIVGGKKAGRIEVCYTDKKLADERPFLKEEEKLINSIAERLGNFLDHRATEEALRENEERFRSLIQTAPGVIVCLSPNHQILEFNTEAERIYGAKREDVLHKDYFELFLPEDIRDTVAADMEKVLKGEPTRGFENVIRAHDGRERLLSWNVNPLLDSANQPMGIITVGLDITEQKKMEEQLKESELLYKTLFQSAPLGVALTTPDGGILTCNDALLSITGYSRAELDDINVRDIYQNPETRAVILESLQKKGFVKDFEVQLKGKGGTLYWASMNMTMLTLEGKDIILTMFWDITDRKKAEEELQRIAWLITRSMEPESTRERHKKYEQPYGNLAKLNKHRVLVDSVGEDSLATMVSSYLDLLETSAAVYEKNGDYALGIFASNWCQFLNEASRNLCNTDDDLEALKSGMWHCHESCWTEASQKCIETGQPVDIECRGGIRIYAVPIKVKGEFTGSINFGYGDPPRDPQKLQEIAERYNVSADELLEKADSYESRPPFMIDLAKNSLIASARLIGALAERKQAEEEKERILTGLNKRIKELSCLYGIDEIEKRENATVEEILGEIVELIPSAWQYPEVTGCCITLDGKEYKTRNFKRTESIEESVITVDGKKAGQIEVCHTGKTSPDSGPPFSEEESRLINSISKRLGEFIEGKKAQEALRASEEKYRDLVENMNDIIYALDTEGIVTYISPAIESFIQYTPREIVGHHFKEFIYREDLQKLTENFQGTFSGHAAANEYRILTKSGDIRWMRTSSRPIFTEDRVTGVQGVLADITSHKKAEEQIRQLSSAVEQSIDGIAIGSMTSEFVYVNQSFAKIHGYSPEEMVGMEILHLHNEEQRDEYERKMDEVMTEGSWMGEIGHIKKDGTPFPAFVATTLLKDDKGRPTGILEVIRDISDRKKAEEQIKASLKEKEVLLREIHHRVKNNLQVISSLLSLQSEHIKDDQYADMFEDSQNRIRSMALIHETLYESENLAHIDLVEYITRLVHELIRSYRAADRIKVSIKVEDVSLGIDAAIPCGLIISELVTNSLKHAFPEGRKGEVNIVLNQRGSVIELQVSDNGVGIQEDIDIRTSESLGLDLVTTLAEVQLNGTIALDRREGTTFRITFER